jgi:hypothetical protein
VRLWVDDDRITCLPTPQDLLIKKFEELIKFTGVKASSSPTVTPQSAGAAWKCARSSSATWRTAVRATPSSLGGWPRLIGPRGVSRQKAAAVQAPKGIVARARARHRPANR